MQADDAVAPGWSELGLEPGASRPASESAVLLITVLSSKPVPEPRAAPGCRATQPGMAQNLEQHPYSILPWQVSNPRLPACFQGSGDKKLKNCLS